MIYGIALFTCLFKLWCKKTCRVDINVPRLLSTIIMFGGGLVYIVLFYLNSLWFLFLQLCIAVPCHMFKLWAFIGIMFQVKSFHFILLWNFTSYPLVLDVNPLVPCLLFCSLLQLFSCLMQVPLVLITNYLQNMFQNSMVCHSLPRKYQIYTWIFKFAVPKSELVVH